jgi:hypothetical protein
MDALEVVLQLQPKKMFNVRLATMKQAFVSFKR